MDSDKLIPNIYHFIYSREKSNTTDIEIYKYFSIKSIIELNNPEKIYFHYTNLPYGKLWNSIKDSLILKNLGSINLINSNNSKNIILFKILIDYGGIYIDFNTLCLRPLTELLKYNFFNSPENYIIGSEKNSYMGFKYFEYYLKNKKFNENYGIININGKNINNYLINNLNYDNSLDNLTNILNKEITDYTFGTYFHLIKNCYFINLLKINDILLNITLLDIFNKITIYNLLIRHILTYNLLYYKYEERIININKKSYINNIDIIYWINLDESIKRKNNMIKLLENFDINNVRFKAFDGALENNIAENYFISENNIYPKYSNKEYAILLSHLSVIETIIKTDDLKYGVCLVCEDDLSLDFMNYWNIDLKSIIENGPQDWDILMLGYFSLKLNYNEKYSKWNNEWSALSYLINKKNISSKISNLKKDDKWLCNEYDLMVSDNYIFSKFNTYVYKYPLMTFPNNNDSTFHEDHLDYHKLYKISNYMTLENMYTKYIL